MMPQRTYFRILVLLIGLAVASVAAAQDLTVHVVSSLRSCADCDATDEQALVMYLHEDQLRMDQGPYSMLIRLSGGFRGLLLLDHGARRAQYLPMEVIAAGEALIDATGTGTAEDATTALEETFGGLAPALTIELVQNGEVEIVEVASRHVSWSNTGSAGLPFAAADERMGGQIPAEQMEEFSEYMRVVQTTSGWSWVDPEIPGSEHLAAFFTTLAQMGVNPYALSSDDPGAMAGIGMFAALTGTMGQIAQHGLPHHTASVTIVELRFGGELAAMAPMLEGMLPPLVSASTSRVHRVDVDPIDNPEALFYGGGTPPGYEVQTLESVAVMD